jgi:peptidoglycan/xylan/chitin deacetylase (PgdA/CDA1 family)
MPTPPGGPRASRLQAWLGRIVPPVSLAAPLLTPLLWRTSPALALGTLFVSHLPFFYGTLAPNRQVFGPVAMGFETAGNEVWLTIDDGPDPIDTPLLLDCLDTAGARATFFVRGDRARTHPHLVREIVRRGHSVANHTDSHPHAKFWRLSAHAIAREVEACNQTLREITGQTPRWFRAPVGMIHPYLHPALEARGLRVVGWSARGLDGLASRAEPAAVVSRILKTLRPGGIALLHEGRRSPAGDPLNVRALELLLAALAERGWRAIIPDDARLR